MVLRFILFAVLAVWVFRVGGSLLKILFSKSDSNPVGQANKAQQFQRTKSPSQKKSRTAGNYQGGDYVDYEEVD